MKPTQLLKQAVAIAAFSVLYAPAHNLRADDVNNLIETILESSPAERAKVENYSNSTKSKKSKTVTNATKNAAVQKDNLVPSMGIPESELLDAAAKFPDDIKGKYIYGTVTFKAVRQYESEPHIQFSSKNRRIFILYTRDREVLNTFSQMTWGTKFTIPKECPLRLLARDLPGMYVVRLPYDMSNKDYTIGELNREFGDSMKKDFQDLGSSFKELGEALKNPISE
jgi:hypothetical protein